MAIPGAPTGRIAIASPRLIPLPCLLLVALAAIPARAQEPGLAGQPWRNPDLPLEKRVDDLVARLTVEEKVAQMMMATPAIPRLGIPAYHWWNEALHGVARAGRATVFPQAIALAATWNPELHRKIADVISTETRAKHHEAARQGKFDIYQGLTLWSPNINIFRDPRWGRGQETYGEDPYLTGRFGVAFVRGIQGDDPTYLKAVATPKHFAVHSGPEPARHGFNAIASPRDLWETYLVAFEASIREGKAASLMSAYNAVNGESATGSRKLLTDILRGKWGFDGAVVSDVDSVGDIFQGHHFATDLAQASAIAVRAGDDECSGTSFRAIPEALKRGLLTEADLDQAVKRLFRVRFRLGLFDPPDRVAYARIPYSENDTPEHDRMALEAARQSLVLLKNDGTLPLKKDLKTVAVIGPVAKSMPVLLGNYHGIPSKPVTLFEGIRRKLEPRGVKVLSGPPIPLVDGFRDNREIIGEDSLVAEYGKGPGLLREVFHNRDLVGTPASARADRAVDIVWNKYNPLPDVPLEDSSLRWSGSLVPPEAGRYEIGASGEGRFRVWLDGKPLLDRWTGQGFRSAAEAVDLEAGKAYPIRVELTHQGDSASLHLSWKTPAVDRAVERSVALAREADAVILTLGITPELEGEEMRVDAVGFKGGDRTTLALPASQERILKAVAAVGKPTVVVLTGGSALAFDQQPAGAVLLAWYSGQRGGDAVADALVGDYNPGGRLPVTFYRGEKDLPAFEDYSMNGRTYRYYAGPVLYPFGHGLSYTTFAYANLKVEPARLTSAAPVRVTVDVTNTGRVEGDEIAELYLAPPKGAGTNLIRQLRGLKREHLQPGETRTLTFDLPPLALTHVNEAGERVLKPGEIAVSVGGGQPGFAANAVGATLPCDLPQEQVLARP
ncbi:Xylan 1,4-beta-xylosidase precursor [Aquisphaera giovannonii]|uniref:Xylan 1,4-beta-xylosidase n=1 Tax=Aquisphaera giovannonii TaxID=406548 RepID=A0A5B9WEU8_9BACT|nr:glycoside hydrolase family 3 protein [Aquisphaera giovannonii]QEH38471.1 Xylan 1,4-beta-xylosidase precursor [Aquisphaera giovannonii]